MMDLIYLILLIAGSLLLIIGIIRVIFAPYTGFLNMLMEMMLLDWMFSLLGDLLSALSDAFDGSDW